MLESAKETWAFLKATDWAMLPELGGYLDQSARLMSAISLIQWRYEVVKNHIAANKTQPKQTKNGAFA